MTRTRKNALNRVFHFTILRNFLQATEMIWIRVESRVSLREEINVKLKPDTFLTEVLLWGNSLLEFDLITRTNRWESGDESRLASCLRRKARVLESVQNLENLDFSELKLKLELCFGEAQSLQNYYFQFTNRKQKFGKSIASFGSDIERLSQLAYLLNFLI